MAININNYNDVFGKLTKAVDIASASDNEEIKKIFSKIKEKVCDIKEGGDRLKRDNEILKIGVVGQVKAGKSSFLNSLLFEGENVLPRASTPMTAGLTVLEFGEKNVFSVEYYTAKVAKTEHSHPLGMVVSTHFRCGKGVKRGLKNGALPFNID